MNSDDEKWFPVSANWYMDASSNYFFYSDPMVTILNSDSIFDSIEDKTSLASKMLKSIGVPIKEM